MASGPRVTSLAVASPSMSHPAAAFFGRFESPVTAWMRPPPEVLASESVEKTTEAEFVLAPRLLVTVR